MKLPDNGECRAPALYLLAPNKASCTMIRLYLIKLLGKGVQWKSQTHQDYAKTTSCSLQHDSKAL